MREFIFSLLFLSTLFVHAADSATNEFVAAMPDAYFLHAYDDCGVAGRQPHVLTNDCYVWTFNTSDTDATPKQRSAVFSYKGISAAYTNLDPKLSYILALTYASDHVYKRVQSLEADGVVLHGPYALPQAEATRVIVRVPREVTSDGQMTLRWKIHGEVNATVSLIELWANAPSNAGLQIASVVGLPNNLEGQVVDLAYDGVAGADVGLVVGQSEIKRTTAGTDGVFAFDRQDVEAVGRGTEVNLLARFGGQEGRAAIKTANLFFEPVHYRPLPEKTGGLKDNCRLLDGVWKLSPNAQNARTSPLSTSDWAPFQVPGQWLQQGFDIPKDKRVAVAKEFVIPKEWTGRRLILRFDAIHAGTRYWLNGHELGYSENLFTPVEWDITDVARPGQTNRLDLEMRVETVSEALSYSSNYAFHNLGGIDRSVRVFALPPTHIRQMHVDALLNDNLRDGELRIQVVLDGGNATANRLSVAIDLRDPAGKSVTLPHAEQTIESPADAEFTTKVVAPLHWSAEKPMLYRLGIELRQNGKMLERIERNIGFRKIEIRGSQLYVNGRSVKLAGACHHEYDPLTGRADPKRHAEEDVRLMKGANLNLIRTSHYPPTQELLDVADRLGMYVESEAPFCWVGGALDNPTNLNATLTPTSAMVDYNHTHPSVLFWSIANESHFNRQFYHSTRMVKELDPTRPTTFNHDFANNPLCKATDIANIHYPSWPSETALSGDPRPLYFGEYFFPICHEQTDVRINPGLRELWGHGQAEPESAFAKAHGEDFAKPPLKPGLPPGEWSRIFHSGRVLGGSIWASHDDAFYFPNGKTAGYAWHHGFWGLIDPWRRPKPEWWLARHIFSPVWIETRHVDFSAGQKSVRIPVENRYAFTDFNELRFDWNIHGHNGRVRTSLAPGGKGELEVPVPPGTLEGDKLFLRVTGLSGQVIHESAILLGKQRPVVLEKPTAGPPQWSDEDGKIIIKGNGFGLVFDRAKGDFDPADRRHRSAIMSFPTVHVTRYDFGDLKALAGLKDSGWYAAFPDARTRRFEKITIAPESTGLRLTVHDSYENFAGSSSWLIDKEGRGVISCDYTYSGQPMETREAGMRLLLKPSCDELKWHRWSEWGVFPDDCISRTDGVARAHRDKKLGEAKWNVKPSWPWSLDESELGTADFRSVKYNIYETSLTSPDGGGVSLQANADAHFRAALATNGVAAHLLWRCPLGQVPVKAGDHVSGEFVVQIPAICSH